MAGGMIPKVTCCLSAIKDGGLDPISPGGSAGVWSDGGLLPTGDSRNRHFVYHCVSQLEISLLPKKYITCISDIGSSNANMVNIIFCCPDAHLLFVLLLWLCHTKVFFDIFSNTYQKGTLMSFQQLKSSSFSNSNSPL